VEAKERLIFALDVPTSRQALEYVELLEGHVGCFKIGLELYTAEGPDLVKKIVKKAPVFLDLKLHDTPATVGRTTSVVDNLGVRYLTIHPDEGGRAMEAATEAARSVEILCVTVLTSISEQDLKNAGYNLSLSNLAWRRAKQAYFTGCSGIICSGHESAYLRAVIGPNKIIVTPGIRLKESKDDQRRTVTPEDAIKGSADLIVVGRDIRDATDPVAVADKIVNQIATAYEQLNNWSIK
jgi:orotidine-5'-phosphate decarboxylase